MPWIIRIKVQFRESPVLSRVVPSAGRCTVNDFGMIPYHNLISNVIYAQQICEYTAIRFFVA